MSNDKLNWATLAPETRIYKGKNLFRWDESPGLEHHCGMCATPLHNSRAKTTCLGKHVEPCYRYHQQLHFVGKSHECFGCNSSDEMHHNRHKDILRLVRQINLSDQEAPDTPPTIVLGASSKRRGSIAASFPTDTSSETFTTDGLKSTRRERKKAKKTGNNVAKEKNNLEIFSTDELGFISEAIHLIKHESKGAWAGTYNYGESHEEFFTPDDIQALANDHKESNPHSDHLAVKPLALLTPRQRKNIKKYSSAANSPRSRGGSRKYSPAISTDVYDGVDPQIFFRLGVEIANPAHNPKSRKELVVKLVNAIKEDLEVIVREEAESAMRREGFWRWAGKPAFTLIARVREDFDWATGQKIEKSDPKREGIAKRVDDELDNEELDSHITETPAIETPIAKQKSELKRTPVSRTVVNDIETYVVQTPRKNNNVLRSHTVKRSQLIDSPEIRLTPSTPIMTASAWANPKPLTFETTPHTSASSPVVTVEEIRDTLGGDDDDDDNGWEVVKPGKGSIAQPVKHKETSEGPQKVFRRLGEYNTIILR